MEAFTVDTRLMPIMQDDRKLKRLTNALIEEFGDQLINIFMNKEYPVTIFRKHMPEVIWGCDTLGLHTWEMAIQPVKLLLNGFVISPEGIGLRVEPAREEDRERLSLLNMMQSEEQIPQCITVARFRSRQGFPAGKEEQLLQIILEHFPQGSVLTFCKMEMLPVKIPDDRL